MEKELSMKSFFFIFSKIELNVFAPIVWIKKECEEF